MYYVIVPAYNDKFVVQFESRNKCKTIHFYACMHFFFICYLFLAGKVERKISIGQFTYSNKTDIHFPFNAI